LDSTSSKEVSTKAQISRLPRETLNDITAALVAERYRYVLAQIQSSNEHSFKLLTMWQTLVTLLAGAEIFLFVNYRQWGIPPSSARLGVVGIALVATIAVIFTILLVVVGVLNWFHYRREEVELSDAFIEEGFRRPPKTKNAFRWYELYMAALMLLSIVMLWLFTTLFMVPRIV
jgi:hypothetical protein